MDDFRKCPITGQLLTPAGFPLEQLSVSVSVGKSPKYRPLMRLQLLRKAWPWTRHHAFLSDEVPRRKFQTSEYYAYIHSSTLICRFAVCRSFLTTFLRSHCGGWWDSGGLSNPGQLQGGPLTSLQGCSRRLLPSCSSLRSRGFLVMSLLSMKDLSQIAALASALLRIPAGSRYSGDVKQLEFEFSNWWLKGADEAFIQLVGSSSLQLLRDPVPKEVGRGGRRLVMPSNVRSQLNL